MSESRLTPTIPRGLDGRANEQIQGNNIAPLAAQIETNSSPKFNTFYIIPDFFKNANLVINIRNF